MARRVGTSSRGDVYQPASKADGVRADADAKEGGGAPLQPDAAEGASAPGMTAGGAGHGDTEPDSRSVGMSQLVSERDARAGARAAQQRTSGPFTNTKRRWGAIARSVGTRGSQKTRKELRHETIAKQLAAEPRGRSVPFGVGESSFLLGAIGSTLDIADGDPESKRRASFDGMDSLAGVIDHDVEDDGDESEAKAMNATAPASAQANWRRLGVGASSYRALLMHAAASDRAMGQIVQKHAPPQPREAHTRAPLRGNVGRSRRGTTPGPLAKHAAASLRAAQINEIRGGGATDGAGKGAVDAASSVARRVALESNSMRERVAYKIEKLLSTPKGLQQLFCMGAVVLVFLGALLLRLSLVLSLETRDIDLDGEFMYDEDEEQPQFMEQVWVAWTYMADPGTHSDVTDWWTRSMSFIISVAGMLFFAMIVGFIVDGIRERMDNLKKGHSVVVETGHFVLLGYSDKIHSLIAELCQSMKSMGGGVIVILSHRDKTELELELKQHFTPASLLGTEIVVRNGSTMLEADLVNVAAHRARASVVLARPGEADKSDADVLRTVLALCGMSVPLRGHIVTEIRDVDNEGLVEVVARGAVESIVSHDVIGRLMINCCRTSGLSSVYEAILGFSGDEFYLRDHGPAIHGITFDQLAARLADAVPIGVKPKGGVVVLNPPGDYKMQPGDELLVLAEDDNTYSLGPPQPVPVVPLPHYEPPPRGPERFLICGWRRDLDDLVEHIDSLVMEGSEVHILSPLSLEERRARLANNGLFEEDLQNVRLVHHIGQPSFRRDLEPLPVEDYDSVLVLSDESHEADALHSDSQAMASLLLIRHLQEARGIVFDLSQAEDDATREELNARAAQSHLFRSSRKTARLARHGDAEAERILELGGSKALPGVGPMPAIHELRRSMSANILTRKMSALSSPGETSQHAAPPMMLVPTADAHQERGGGGGGGAKHLPLLEGSSMTEARKRRQTRRSVEHDHREDDVDDDAADNVQIGQLSTPSPPRVPGQSQQPTAPKTSAVFCCELLDARTRSVLFTRELAGLANFILTNLIVSRVLAMVAERKEIRAVLNEILGAYGNDIELVPAQKYVELGTKASFADVSHRARGYKEIIIGVRRVVETEDGPVDNVSLNPRNKFEPVWWHKGDQFVVLAPTTARQEEREADYAAADLARTHSSVSHHGVRHGTAGDLHLKTADSAASGMTRKSTGLVDGTRKTQRMRKRLAEQSAGGGDGSDGTLASTAEGASTDGNERAAPPAT